MDNQNIEKKEGDFDVIGILKIGWDQRRFIVKMIAIFALMGLIFAFLYPKKYEASSTFLPQVENASRGGQLGGLASLAGINLGSSSATSEIPPTLYPEIVKSVSFKRELIRTPITLEEEGRTVTYAKYFENHHDPGVLAGIKKYTIGLPGVVIKLFSGASDKEKQEEEVEPSPLFKLSPQERKHFSRIETQVEVNYTSREKTVELSFKMPEALMAAEMAKAAEELLQKEVIAFRIQNAQEQLEFTERQFEEKRNAFVEKQRELANFRDRNQNIASAVARNQLQRLEAEYNFAFNLYTEMAKQLEQSRLQVSKDTPIFSVIDPVVVPHVPSAPKRLHILLAFLIVGFLMAIATLFVQHFFMDLKEEFARKERDAETS